MLQFKQWLNENEVKWKFINSDHAFDRLKERTSFTFADEDTVKNSILKKVAGLRLGEYGFASKKFYKIFIAEVNPVKKTVKVITVLNGDMKLKSGTPRIITESMVFIDID